MKPFEMAFPDSVEEACEFLERYDNAKVIAGGTALTTVIKEGIYQPDILINLRGLEDSLASIEDDGEAIRIGALATLREVETNEFVKEHLPTVHDCLTKIAGVRVRNSGTLGGNLAHADIHLDLPPVLGGYGATVVITDGSNTRELPITEFFKGYYETDLDDGELITEIVIPKPDPNIKSTYIKHRYYSEVDWPCVGVAAFAVEDGDSYEDVQVLLNSVGQSAILEIEGIDDIVDGDFGEDEIEEIGDLAIEQASPIDDLRGSAEYKKQVTDVFTRRALQTITQGESQ